MTADNGETPNSNGDAEGAASAAPDPGRKNSVEANLIFSPPSEISESAHVKSFDEYKSTYKKSIENPDEFWGNIAKDFFFEKAQPANNNKVLDYNFNIKNGPIFIKFMEGSKTNICYNLLDYNIQTRGLKDAVAFYWEGNEPTDSDSITYGELHKQVCKFSNVLKSLGVGKGDRVAVYMPMILEVAVVMLACARIGAVHSVVFGGFSSQSLADRIVDGKCKILVTGALTMRGDKIIHLKEIADEALKISDKQNHTVEHCVVVKHAYQKQEKVSGQETPKKKNQLDYQVPFNSERDKWYHEIMVNSSDDCPAEWVDAEDPLFMLYTSGSTGKPKGVLHSTAGYMVYVATTFKYVFDYHPKDVYWCTADVGWITGHSYLLYGPLLNGATSIMFEGTPFYPDNSRIWAVIEKYKVNQFYTAPTAIRSLMKFGNDPVLKHNRDSLKILGTVGEPINPEAWLWYYNVVGNGKCPCVDTFWQTETGGHVITPLPGATKTKPGSATFPFYGVVPQLVTEEGKTIEGPGEGYLVFSQPWPSLMRTVYGDHSRFETTYFAKFPGFYCTGDGAKRDEDGYLWITGRVDDMLNVSGHLLSTAQVESALIEHEAVAESAAVAKNHDIKGEAVYCFVTLRDGFEWNSKIIQELKMIVREKIGAFATPDVLQLAPALPKTRSGKIMRRILRKIAADESSFGDISTLADESVIQLLLDNKPKK